jgi:membrane protein DedA with SNARE-associated domain
MTTNSNTRFLLDLLAVPVIAAATLAAGWYWLARDTEYQTDPATGISSGPYEAWQVAACVLSLAVVAAVGGALVRPWLVAATMAVSATALFATVAAPRDETGLWVVGAVMTAGGVTASTAAVAYGAWFGRRALR